MALASSVFLFWVRACAAEGLGGLGGVMESLMRRLKLTVDRQRVGTYIELLLGAILTLNAEA
jgi:hypothetical protein